MAREAGRNPQRRWDGEQGGKLREEAGRTEGSDSPPRAPLPSTHGLWHTPSGGARDPAPPAALNWSRDPSSIETTPGSLKCHLPHGPGSRPRRGSRNRAGTTLVWEDSSILINDSHAKAGSSWFLLLGTIKIPIYIQQERQEYKRLYYLTEMKYVLNGDIRRGLWEFGRRRD